MIIYGLAPEQIGALVRLERDNQNFETPSQGRHARLRLIVNHKQQSSHKAHPGKDQET